MRIEIGREEDGRWIAEVPDLPGVMVYGKTREQAISKQAFDSESDMRGSRSAQVRRFRVVRGSICVGMCCTWIHHLVLTQ